MKIGIPVYQGVNLLDVTGPLEMFYWAGVPKDEGGAGQHLKTVIVSEDGRGVTSHNDVYFQAHESFAEAPTLDVLWVPGAGSETIGCMMRDATSSYLAYLCRVAANAKWVCSVCEGALLLARAGLLDGYEATTHWAVLPCLTKRHFPDVNVAPGYPRYWHDRNRLTGGGVSSGLDEALKLICLLFDDEAARTVQRVTQYYPRPPVEGQIEPAMSCPIHWT